MRIKGQTSLEVSSVLTPTALDFLVKLHRQFEPRRRELIAARTARQAQLD
ncbi:MAG: hypothetical protein ACRC01_00025, partial [Deefgea sp.]